MLCLLVWFSIGLSVFDVQRSDASPFDVVKINGSSAVGTSSNASSHADIVLALAIARPGAAVKLVRIHSEL